MGFFDKKGLTVPLNVPLLAHLKDYTITFYTGGIDINTWADLTPAQQKAALNKPWYIRWYFRDSATGRLVRQHNIKAGINRIKTKKARLEAMEIYRAGMIQALRQGYNPLNPGGPTPDQSQPLEVKAALELALEVKINTVSPGTWQDYRRHAERFIQFMAKNHLEARLITQVTRRQVSQFLDQVLAESSARNRNNVRATLSALFSALRDRFILERNFIDTDIKKLKTESKKDRRVSLDTLAALSRHLKNTDTQLLLYLKMVSYNFMRPIEVNRLQVRDIDLKGRTLYFDQKTKKGKTKYLPDIYFKDLAQRIAAAKDPGHYLFTPSGLPGPWPVTDQLKRDYFSKKFKKHRDALGITGDISLYSFRHTFITGAYSSLRDKGLSDPEALAQLMLITGHTSQEGILKYIHSLDANLPPDWSDLFGFTL